MSRIESYVGMFDADAAQGAAIRRVEIPLIQRDYAQGRRNEKVDTIRRNFLDVLHSALEGDSSQPVSLDFVYGDLDTNGVLQPLDGQQRLTTLFLLHWYFAVRREPPESAAPWMNFSYETRPSARRFCDRLVKASPPADVACLSAWITEQPWYLFVWRYDPTIDAMLVMLDAINDRFRDMDPEYAWSRLTDIENPAISFHLLPLPDMGSPEELYVKMNSRGKPLTEFENFKAGFEALIEDLTEYADELARKVDTDWADALWAFRGSDEVIDDEFMRYFEFVTEICEWSDPNTARSPRQGSLARRTEAVFGAGNPSRTTHLRFLFDAFDTWVKHDSATVFGDIFGRAKSGERAESPVPLFRGRIVRADVNLFEECCNNYGSMSGNNRAFTFGSTLLLFAVILHLVNKTPEFSRRVRTLRNLIEASSSEMRADTMAQLVADTRALIVDGTNPARGNSFNIAQVADELEKQGFLARHPDLVGVVFELEDDGVLRGSLSAFDLDESRITSRAKVFRALMSSPGLWSEAGGALLTVGEYQRPRQTTNPLDSASFQFAPTNGRVADVWRALLTGRSREDLANTRSVLGQFLDRIAEPDALTTKTLTAMQDRWLAAQDFDGSFDWRYYFVRYPTMRSGEGGIYFAEGRRMGFGLCNLVRSNVQRNSNYRDPFLLTIWESMDSPEEIIDPWFTGYEWSPRWLRLRTSGAGIRAIDAGFEVSPPTAEEFAAKFDELRPLYQESIDELGQPNLVVAVDKLSDEPGSPDSEDRIQVGIGLMRQLIEAGLGQSRWP
jgi:hypothetical protein